MPEGMDKQFSYWDVHLLQPDQFDNLNNILSPNVQYIWVCQTSVSTNPRSPNWGPIGMSEHSKQNELTDMWLQAKELDGVL